MNPYLRAVAEIPAGQTRSFMELAALAGRPGAARAAGRAIRACPPDSRLPLHRVVSADGHTRDEAQLRRLRREGARPRASESIPAWAERVRARFIGLYGLCRPHGNRPFVRRGDVRADRWDPKRVEALADEPAALARGFLPAGSAITAGTTPRLPEKQCIAPPPETRPLRERLAALDWDSVRLRLVRDGVCRLEALLNPSECASILNASTTQDRFERSIDMLARGYGVGAYHYYKEPIPIKARILREVFYRQLAEKDHPATLEEFWMRCRDEGQRRASTILIGYGEGGVNHPHRDIYGRLFFPYQALIMLSRRGRDFEGGAFYVEDETGPRPARALSVDEGDVVIFASKDRRENGKTIPMRHGMRPVTKGRRWGVGVVFHLAE